MSRRLGSGVHSNVAPSLEPLDDSSTDGPTPVVPCYAPTCPLFPRAPCIQNCPVDCDNDSVALYKLNACCLRQDMGEMRRYNYLTFFFDLLESTSAFLFMAPMLALADVWGRRSQTNKLMLAAFAASAGVSLLEFLFRAGTTTTVNWISSWVRLSLIHI